MSKTAVIGRRITRENSTWNHKELLMTVMMKVWYCTVFWKQTGVRRANAHQKVDQTTTSSRASEK